MNLYSAFILDFWPIAGSSDWLAATTGRFCEAAASIAVTAAWQGMLVAAGLVIAQRLLPRFTAAHRFLIWAAGFALVAVLPFLPMLASLAAFPAHGDTVGAVGASARPWLQMDSRWSLAIAALWLAASVFRAIRLALQGVYLRRLGKSALPAPESFPDSFSTGSVRIPGRGSVRICTTKLLESPGAIGFLTPRILIPEWLGSRLTPAEFEQIVLHEAEHLRRRDDWTNLIEKICLAIFPLNPALWWIDRRLLLEREMACDEGVVRATQAPRSYAACLTNLAERSLEQRAEVLSLGAWRRRPELMHRVQSILRPRTVPGPWAMRLLAGAIVCGLLVASVELMRSPQLIAFTPAQGDKAATADGRLQAEASPEPFPGTAGRRPVGLGGGNAAPHLTKMMAILPLAQPAMPTPARASLAPSRRRQGAEAASFSASAQARSETSREALPKAELSGSGQSAATEEWIVFTSWEQVRRSDSAAQDATQSEFAAKGDGQPFGDAQPQENSTDVVVIEQLVLKVVPLVYRPVPAARSQLSAGWLVLQL